jgi:inosine-uridine nucleoside N-ribohydrolase
MRYITEPADSDGARLIIERAHAGSVDGPLWVVVLGAASNIASALLLDPSITEQIRLVFHARSEWSWPERSEQFNVSGDIPAVRRLLISGVPLVWFDTGQQLTCPVQETERELLPPGGMAAFLHEFRKRADHWMSDQKGFYDLGDIAWLIDPSVCTNEVVDVPHMDAKMHFHQNADLGKMVRAHSVSREPVWALFFKRMKGAGRAR